MKRIIMMLAIVLAVSLVGCGSSGSASGSAKSGASGANAAQASGASAAQSADKPDKNGFDEATNQVVNVLGVEFSFPSYFQETSNKDGKLIYEVPPVDGVSENVTAICFNDPSAKAASVEKFQEVKESSLLSVFSPDKFKNVKLVDSVDGGIADLPSGVYSLTGTFVSGGESHDFTARAGKFLNGNLQVGTVFLMQFDTAKSNYLPDFDKVLASARVVEQPPAEGAPAEGASDGVSPDVREALDSYEAFIDEYIDFMQRYKDSGNTTAMLNDYLSYLQRYSDFVAKVDAMKTDNMSNADLAYYLEVTARVSQKLLDAMV